jgi:hypothetical protein
VATGASTGVSDYAQEVTANPTAAMPSMRYGLRSADGAPAASWRRLWVEVM